MTKYDSRQDTVAHIRMVSDFLDDIAEQLMQRGATHDASKLEDPEKSIFDEYTPKLKGTTFGSDEYKQCLAGMQVALNNHYVMNRHHPEHFVGGIRGMNMVDLVEMFCDWVAASMRHDDGDPIKSIQINQERFGYSDDIKQILLNTVELLF